MLEYVHVSVTNEFTQFDSLLSTSFAYAYIIATVSLFTTNVYFAFHSKSGNSSHN